MLYALPCRDCPTERVPAAQLPAAAPAYGFSEADLLAVDLRSCADRISRLDFWHDGPENLATLLRELAEAVERAAK